MLRPEMSFVGEPLADDIARYFHSCPHCGQGVDRRDLAAVYYHEGVGHGPLPTREALRLVLADEQLASALRLKPS